MSWETKTYYIQLLSILLVTGCTAHHNTWQYVKNNFEVVLEYQSSAMLVVDVAGKDSSFKSCISVHDLCGAVQSSKSKGSFEYDCKKRDIKQFIGRTVSENEFPELGERQYLVDFSYYQELEKAGLDSVLKKFPLHDGIYLEQMIRQEMNALVYYYYLQGISVVDAYSIAGEDFIPFKYSIKNRK